MRISSLSLLSEIWLTYSSFIDSNQSYLSSIQQAYQKGVRDKVRTIRIVAAAQMFKLLEKFSEEKN